MIKGDDATLPEPGREGRRTGQPTPGDSSGGAVRLGTTLDLVGARLGSYEIRELIGRGGLGVVYLAYDQRLTRQVALKLLRTNDPRSARRLLGEARAQARVDHENVCRVYEAGEIEGYPFIAMQYIEGPPLRQCFHQMSREEIVRVVQRAAEGLHEAHSQHLIHRDVKPGNILVERTAKGDWKPYVVDFGLARETEAVGETMTGEVKGTPAYMAPEQVTGQGATLDPRTDVYGLGATLYEGLCRKPPFSDPGGGLKILLKVLVEYPQAPRAIDPSIPVDLESIVLQCLEKDQKRRYPTAQALADDLQRFLDGEPIEARPIDTMTKVWRGLRKRRVAALSAGLAIMAVGAAMLLFTHLQSAARIRLLDEYRRDARYIDQLIGDAYRAPTHDITGEKQQVRARLAAVQQRVREQGSLAVAPAHFALGRGFLALQDYEQAHRHLARAWEDGLHDPEVGYALGRTLGARYEQELRVALRIQDQQQRAARLAEIQRLYREPALQRLQESREVQVDSVTLVEARMAFWEGRYEEALAKAAAAQREVPWLYEAQILQGDVEVAAGSDHYARGAYQQALAAYERARIAYAAAAEKGRSDPRVGEGQCTLAGELMRLASYGLQTATRPHFEYGVEACARARQIDPRRAEPYLLESLLYWRQGEAQNMYGDADPSELLRRADSAAARAIELAPRRVEAHASQGWSRVLLADWQSAHGIDPRPAAAGALATFRGAVRLDPNYAQNHNGLGYTHLQLAEWEIENGRDPTASLAAANAALERALQLSPEYVYAWDNLASVHALTARWQASRGLDCSASALAAVRGFERLRELNPNYIWAQIGIGEAWNFAAQSQVDRGADPADSLARATVAYQAALQLNASEPEPRLGLARVALLEARWRLRDGVDPLPALERARALVEPLLGERRVALQAHLNALELELAQGDWQLGLGGSPAAAVERGLALTEAARAINPHQSEIAAFEGSLLLLRAEAGGGVARRRDLAAGRSALARAFAANRNLDRRFAPALARATRLAGVS